MTSSTRRRSLLRLVLVGFVLVTGLVVQAGAAVAHTELVSTDPAEGAVLDAPPDSLRFTFNEPVTLSGEAVQVFDAGGAEITSGSRVVDTVLLVEVPQPLGRGSYVVTWRVVSQDGHPIAGALTFSVGAPSTSVVIPEPQQPAAAVRTLVSLTQGLTYLAVFATAGLVAFWVLVLRGAAPLAHRLVVRSTASCGAAAVAGSLILVPLTAVRQAGGTLSDLSAALSAGASWGHSRPEPQAALLVVLGVAVALACLHHGPAAFGLVGGAVALGSLAYVGHTRSYGPTALVVGSDLVHVAAAAVWSGGLLGLVLVVPRVAGAVGAAVLARFSTVAAGLVALVAVSGTLLAWRILGSWDDLLDSPFGRILLIKVALVLLVVALAAWNRFRLLPAVQRLPEGPARHHLVSTVRLEAAGLAAVLLLTGWLVEQSPSVEPATAPRASSSFMAESGEVRAYVVVDPRVVGRNDVEVRLEDLRGRPLRPLEPPVLTATLGTLSLGRQDLDAVGPGTYRRSVFLPRAGEWTLRVTVRVSRFASPPLEFAVPVGGR